MNDDFGTLLTIAEIAAAFAGFAAIVSALSRRVNDGQRKLQFARLITIVSSSLHVIFGALLPIIFARFGIGEDASWRAASASYLVINWVLIVILVRVFRPLGLRATDDPGAKFVYPAEAIFQGLLLLGTLGFLGALLPGAYLVALALGLAQIAVTFVLIIWTTFSVEVEAGDDVE